MSSTWHGRAYALSDMVSQACCLLGWQLGSVRALTAGSFSAISIKIGKAQNKAKRILRVTRPGVSQHFRPTKRTTVIPGNAE